MTIVAVTGHRPDKLGGYGPDTFSRLVDLAANWLRDERPDRVITGMALGWDQAVATASVHLEIPFLAAVPFYGQEALWPDDARRCYRDLLHSASEVVMVSGGSFSAAKLHYRNRWMVDRCDKLGALWNGDADGGAASTVAYANKVSRPVVNLWEAWMANKEMRVA